MVLTLKCPFSSPRCCFLTSSCLFGKAIPKLTSNDQFFQLPNQHSNLPDLMAGRKCTNR
jgi:hypothetical protein